MTRMFQGLLVLGLAIGISSSVPAYSAPASSDPAALTSAKAVLKDLQSTPKTLNENVAKLTDLLKKSPQNAEAYCYRGELYERLNKEQESFSDFNKALELDPKLGRAYLDRGIAWFMKANTAKALSDFDNAIVNGEKTHMVYQNRGAAYQQQNQHDKAILDFTESIKLDPSWTAHIMRANSYLLTGKIDQAIKDWDAVLEAKGVPNEARTDVYQRRGLALAIANRLEDAIQDFTVAANNLQGVQKGRVISLRASAYNKLGEKDKAEADRKLAESLGYKKVVVKPGPANKPVHAEPVDKVKKLEEAIKPLEDKARRDAGR